MARFTRRTGPLVSASAWMLAILAGALALPLHAADCLWSGAEGNWDDPTQWSDCGGGSPGPGDTAIIGAGEVTLPASTTVAGLTMTGGALRSTGTAIHLTVTDSLLLTGENLKRFVGLTVRNEGSARWDAGGWRFGTWPDPTSEFHNLAGADFEIVGQLSLQHSAGSRLINEGMISKTGVGLASLDSLTFRNDGLIRVEAGQLRLWNGIWNDPHTGAFEIESGTSLELYTSHQFGPSSSITGAGTMIFGGGGTHGVRDFILQEGMTYQLGGRTLARCFACNIVVHNAAVTGELDLFPVYVGTTPGSAWIFGQGSLTVTGQTRWDRGMFGNEWNPSNLTVDLLGGLSLYGLQSHTMRGAVVRNHGLAVYSSGSFAISDPTARFINLPGARFEMQGPRDLVCRDVGYGSPALGRFVNQGELIKSNGGDAFVTCLILENQGTLEVQEGRLSVRPTNQGVRPPPEGGRLILADGLTISGEPIAIEASSWLLGIGEVDASVEIRGHISPGHPGFGGTPWETARIIINGDLSLDSDSRYLAKILDDGGPGIGHDLVLVEGEAALGGLLQISLHPDFDPPAGTEFTVLTCSESCLGFFDQLVVNPPGSFFELLHEANQISVRRISERIFHDAFISPSQGQ